MPTLTVIGIGSRLRGDDGVGPALIDALKEEKTEILELIDGGSDTLNIVPLLEDRKHVIIVDAARMGTPPGTMKIFSATEVSMVVKEDPFSLHGLGLAEAVKMAASLDLLPDDVKFIGIEPESVNVNSELSHSVELALQQAVEVVFQELGRLTIA